MAAATTSTAVRCLSIWGIPSAVGWSSSVTPLAAGQFPVPLDLLPAALARRGRQRPTGRHRGDRGCVVVPAAGRRKRHSTGGHGQQ